MTGAGLGREWREARGNCALTYKIRAILLVRQGPHPSPLLPLASRDTQPSCGLLLNLYDILPSKVCMPILRSLFLPHAVPRSAPHLTTNIHFRLLALLLVDTDRPP